MSNCGSGILTLVAAHLAVRVHVARIFVAFANVGPVQTMNTFVVASGFRQSTCLPKTFACNQMPISFQVGMNIMFELLHVH